MNGIERITQLIQTEAQAEIDGILKKAQEDAAAIQARYQAQAETEAAELALKNQKAAEEREERLVSVAQMESRKIILATKQEMVEKAYELALEKLRSMPEDQCTAVLAELLVQASTDGKEEVIFSPEDRERIGKAAIERANTASGKQLRLSPDTRSIQGGFILKNGNIEVNCTFDTLVRLQKTETAGTVARKLFR